MAYDSNDGVARLAAVLDARMRDHADKPLCLDFAEIQADGSLLSNTFPIPIPKSDYRVCRQLTLGRREMHFAMSGQMNILEKHIFRNLCGSCRPETEC